jgi:hypothetical protein
MAYKWKPKDEDVEAAEVKPPHAIPDPPPPSDPPETDREPNVISTKINKEEKTLTEARGNIHSAITLLRSLRTDAAILAIGKLEGALKRLDLNS